MIERGRPGLIINTGSKQGITTPPGDPAYNVSKAGVKAFTEALQHELRNTPDCRISAHLLIPGFVFTGADRARPHREAAGRLDARADRRFHAASGWRPATSTSSAPTTTCRAASTSGASSGRPATSSRTARRCRAGIRIMRTPLRRLRRGNSRAQCWRGAAFAFSDLDRQTAPSAVIASDAKQSISPRVEDRSIPVDFGSADKNAIAATAINLRSITSDASKANTLGLIILDACRDNPFLSHR